MSETRAPESTKPTQSAAGSGRAQEKRPAQIGYVRLGPGESSSQSQKRALEEAGCAQIFEDHPNSNASEARPGFEAALAAAAPGDTLVVWRLDRLGQSLPKLVEVMKGLSERGVQFRSLSEDIDTSSPGGELVYQVIMALVDCERALISERTRAGMQAAQEAGRPLGRRPALSQEQCKDVIDAVMQRGEPIESVAQRYNVHTRTIRRVLSRARSVADSPGAASRQPQRKTGSSR